MKKLAITLFLTVLAISCSGGGEKPQTADQSLTPKPAAESGTKSNSYNVELKTEPGEIKADQLVKLTFTVKDPTGKKTSDLEIVHEKPMHLLVASSDLAQFDHIHPAPNSDGLYVVETKFPTSGKYKLYLDYTPKDESQQVSIIDIDVAGAPQQPVKLVADSEDTKIFDNLRLTMKPDKPFKAGEAITLNFNVADAKTGKPVTDLQPYLGALAHFVIISEDTKEFLHAHPMEKGEEHNHDANSKVHHHEPPKGGGPEVLAQTLFPKPGLYKAWAQFQRGGKVITGNFIFNVAEADPKAAPLSAKVENGVQKLNVTISGEGYEPSSFQLKRGIPAQITFLRKDEFNCGEELVFKDYGINEKIPVGVPILVQITPEKEGTFEFTCGMQMYRGSVVVSN
jgi:hypothetical protein